MFRPNCRRDAAKPSLANLLLTVVLSVSVNALPPQQIPDPRPRIQTNQKQESNQKREYEVTVGKPSVWSFAQAHYLLANIRERNQGIEAKGINADDLDANAVNRHKIEVLQSLLTIEGTYDASLGIQNRLRMDQYNRSNKRALDTQERLDQARTDYSDVTQEIGRLKKRLEKQKAKLDDIPTGEKATDKDAANVKAANKEIADLQGQIQAKETERQGIKDEITSRTTELDSLNSKLSTYSFSVPELPSSTQGKESGGNGGASGASSAPKSQKELDATVPKEEVAEAIKKQIQEYVGNSPKQNASTIIDNYVQLQYEIVAKQLTLLRDEVGPDHRIIFLELPSSVYISPKHADRALAQARWKVVGYKQKNGERVTIGDGDSAHDLDVHAVEIIPRQSALNVSELHKTVAGFSLAAKFVSFFGVGARVDYQKQRELFDQFLYQEIFASGFGKGEAEFGWTFGPLPGTKSVAPGVRTTYAILAVPNDVAELEVEGYGYSFARNSGPSTALSAISKAKFNLKVPGRENGFDIREINYVPVAIGEPITVILKGAYFSPQVGVLVNNVPLKRVVSVARTVPGANDPLILKGPDGKPVNKPAANLDLNPVGIQGEFEYVNSQTVILSFKMSSSYEGTPLITLVTPELAESINDIALLINGSINQKVSANTEPMFIRSLSVTGLLSLPSTEVGKTRVVLLGTGFRNNAKILVNGVDARAVYKTSQRYEVEFATPRDVWNFYVEQPTGQRYEEFSYTRSNTGDPVVDMNVWWFTPATKATEAQVRVQFDFSQPQDGSSIDFGAYVIDVNDTSEASIVRDNTAANASKRFATLTIHKDVNPLLLKLTTQETQWVIGYLQLEIPAPPVIESLTPLGDVKPEGGFKVEIRGRNLRQVQRVEFGSARVEISEATDKLIVVTAPKGEGKVRVVLTTDIKFRGKNLDNSADFIDSKRAIFDYNPKPATPAAGGSTGTSGTGNLE